MVYEIINNIILLLNIITMNFYVIKIKIILIFHLYFIFKESLFIYIFHNYYY